MGNHDFARMVSRFGDDKKYWSVSAKMLLIMQATQNGTLNIYQGDEIGMTNIELESVNEIRDIQSLNFYNENLETKRYSNESALKMINNEGRDNARTTMQWNDEINGGFTIEKDPWIRVNPNYHSINVKNQENNPDSILSFYRNLLKIRKQHDVFVYGDFEELEFNNPQIYAYKKKFKEEEIIVILNFSKTKLDFKIPEGVNVVEPLINNYKVLEMNDNIINLEPYQGVIFKV